MSYYILPKNINLINVNPQYSEKKCLPYISNSLLNYYIQTKKQIIEMFNNDSDLSNNTFEQATKIINPYEFIFSKVPGSKFSVSKLKQKTNIFYDLLEISNNLNIFDNFTTSNNINFLHITPNYSDSIECFEMFRENCSDKHLFNDNIKLENKLENNLQISENKFDFIFLEVDISDYFNTFIHAILIILKNQNNKGISIIKIDNIFYKPIVDMIFFLSSLYDKVYICKPNTNNVTSYEKYIVCKNFIHNEDSNTYLKFNYLKLFVFIKKMDNKNIISILDFDIPYYFKNKLDDLNIIIGQQQLDALDQIISIYKNKNKDEKCEMLKKNNIQKSVSWCEKYKIPCNKFTEKINIFLPIANEV